MLNALSAIQRIRSFLEHFFQFFGKYQFFFLQVIVKYLFQLVYRCRIIHPQVLLNEVDLSFFQVFMNGLLLILQK